MLRASTRRSLLLSTGWLALAASTPAPAAGKKTKAAAPVSDDAVPDLLTYGERDDVMRFADALAERRELDAAWVRAALAQARFVPSVVRYIMPPPAGTAKNWAAYRARFVEPVRIKAGAQFWKANQAWLSTAEELYGVPPEIVVGIVGVETIYGRQMGNFRVIDALSTLAFDFPVGGSDRSDFFKGELESWFVLCKSEGVEPLAWTGSYAGAIGMAQFMPSSFNKYAVDLDGDGHVDLQHSAADVIGSVANYLAEFGWKRGLPVRFAVKPPQAAEMRAALLAADIVPTFSAAEMTERGAVLPPAASKVDSALALIELQNGTAAPSYVAGTVNFYAITRYNRSSYYAMAVTNLGEAVRRAADGRHA
jgi:membrane-bound lytic murein transglycosylase B